MTALKSRIKAGIKTAPVFSTGKPVVVHIDFFMRRPLDHFKADDRSRALKSNAPIAHTHQPDLDNLVKFVLDGMNKLVYGDDKQVVQVVATKQKGLS